MDSPLVLFVAVLGLGLVGCKSVPPLIQVLSPSEFNIVLPEQENDTLMVARVGINDEIGFVEDDSHFVRTNIDGRVVHFSERALDLKNGDRMYYSLLFVDRNGKMRVNTGEYTFDGVFKTPERRKREIYDFVLDGSPEFNLNHHDRPPRYESGHGHSHDGPHGNFNPHGSHHGSPGTHHFAPHPYHHPPPHGHGAWKGQGDHFGDNGPWDGHNHDGMGCDNHGDNPKYPQRPEHKKPWGGGDPYGGNDRFDNPYGEKKPSRGDNNENDRKDKTTDNPNAEVFTTKRPSTTQRTTTAPDIDIRFRVPEDS